MEMRNGSSIRSLTAALFVCLFALGGCAGSDTFATPQFTPKQVIVSGTLDSGVAKTATKDAAAAAGSTGTVTVVDAFTGATVSTAPANIVNNQFSVSFNVATQKSAFILVATMSGTSAPTYRALMPLDLSNAPTGLSINYPLTGLIVGPTSEATVQAVQTALNVKGSLGIDNGAAFPAGTGFGTVSNAVLSNGGGVVAYGSTGITMIGSMETASQTQFVFTSDAHYGIKRAVAFNGYSSGFQVNGAMIGMMNSLPNVTFPCNDSGVNACQSIGAVDFVVEGGDIANRSEGATNQQNAATSWAQFKADYIDGLTLKDRTGKRSTLYMIPGNHDVSNAIGYYKTPLNTGAGLDATSYTQIYNLMMKPATTLTNAAFVGATPSAATAAASYAANRVFYSKDMNGVHFVFITMWPDSLARAQIDADLANVSATTPVILFTHDQPDIETKHLLNPNGTHDINATDKFENMVADQSQDTDSSGNKTINAPSTTAQRALVAWLKTHKNIVAYFHGNDHINGAYTYTGPDNDISLNVFRVDSPMKGIVSLSDPSQLIFKVVAIDSAVQKMTVRDYLWNTKRWGASTTVSLTPRAK